MREISNIKYQISKCLKHFRFYIVILIFTFYILILPPTPVYAANPCTPDPKGGFNIGSCFGFGDITSLGQATSRLVIPVFSIAAAAVVIYFLLGAFKYLSSGGNKEAVAGARGMITHAIIGFLILMFAFLILQFLISSLFGITNFQLF
ncbi:MAG: hypothetical protein ACD_38C00139G0016 [uncultured bacterium]|uniref:Uncharacterized protein n=1 Tax=Candidatus Daviesbacteria bacterium GW2011_GWC2_40_12 TaxID=1618431 RepID=A0A0G0T3C2_9BACT|nr:MAG: hypothetical protein ACD_38C00139G0016 [uncultured bacterium]KKQ85323.1 MAG: hypothetical protein UT04_C0005G0016 [Candidatus Daviesbacteria bacterium GW2011_GWF2_38_7]KKR16259.1 MAG: hypothetical protein UT45_C0007G0016 [Candidatus Daviesbacteria bacterium GW2011_GWA2_39_33]KKR24725.1 MAG: hypothetical protein UT54_C0013G0009 [Candidatus Daviesbacteria bacterium GW2011_GWB1_39_5]KKR41585.1 MAG: hypothetical protein UT77_C0009G0043 [Candidatus Daviesbacteria bacterium GW2011_GWC2_40_12]